MVVLAWAVLCVPIDASASGSPIVSANDLTITETNANTAAATFDVMLSKKSKKRVSVAYATQDGSATGGPDFVPTNGVLHFKPGQKKLHVHVTIVGDTLWEPTESFSLQLSSPKNAVVGDPGVATVLDDDPKPPDISFTTDTGSGKENIASPTITVQLSKPWTDPVSVLIQTSGSAAQNADYGLTTPSVTFPAGTTTHAVTVQVMDDSTPENDETIALTLSDPQASDQPAFLGTPSTFTYTIDDDDPSSVVVTPASPTKRQDETQQFTATANYVDGTAIDVTSSATWQSGNTNVATITSGGLATAVNQGTSAIHATFHTVDGQTPLTVQCRLHSNGQGQTYANCGALGTYNAQTGFAAAGAWVSAHGGGSSTTGTCGTDSVVISNDAAHSMMGVWSYSGPNVGHSRVVAGTVASCPGAADPTWN